MLVGSLAFFLSCLGIYPSVGETLDSGVSSAGSDMGTVIGGGSFWVASNKEAAGEEVGGPAEEPAYGEEYRYEHDAGDEDAVRYSDEEAAPYEHEEGQQSN